MDDAISSFKKKFKDKTKNDWDKRDNFVAKPGKYTMIEIGELLNYIYIFFKSGNDVVTPCYSILQNMTLDPMMVVAYLYKLRDKCLVVQKCWCIHQGPAGPTN